MHAPVLHSPPIAPAQHRTRPSMCWEINIFRHTIQMHPRNLLHKKKADVAAAVCTSLHCAKTPQPAVIVCYTHMCASVVCHMHHTNSTALLKLDKPNPPNTCKPSKSFVWPEQTPSNKVSWKRRHPLSTPPHLGSSR